MTSDFAGANGAEPLPGKEGESSIRVYWTPAETGNSTFRLNDFDPIAYEVTYTESQNGFAGLEENSTTRDKFTIPSTLSASISYSSEVIVKDLKPGTNYLFRVRAINYGYYLDKQENSGLNYQYEQNNQIVSASTRNVSIEYGLSNNKINVRQANGFDALKSLSVNWSVGTGGFNSYRVYIKKLDLAANDPTGCNVNIKNCAFITGEVCEPYNQGAGEGCYQVSSNSNSATFSDLEPYTNYQVVLAVCGGEMCEERIFSNEEVAGTFPSLSLFEGISEVEFARSAGELARGDVHLNFPPIDVERGILMT